MLFILGIVAIVVFTIQVYKTASGTGRNAAVWAAINAVVGVGLQFVVPVFIGLIFGIYIVATGGAVEDIEGSYFGFLTLISIAGIVASIVGMWLVMKHVSKVTDDGVSAPPPPPPAFRQ